MIFKGIYPAVITPYKENGEIDFEAYQRMLDYLFDSGVDGIFAIGSTAEFPLLTDDEKHQLIDLSVKCAKGRGNVIVQVGDQGTDKSIKLAKYAEKAGAQAVIAIAPAYYKHSPKDIVQFYHDIASSINIPLMAYEIPHFTGRNLLSDEYLFDLMKHPNFIGFKGTTSDLYLEERFKRLYNDKVLLHGFDESFTGALLVGADGGIGGTYAIMPKLFIQMYKSIVEEKDIDKARRLQHICNTVIDKMIPLNHTVAANYLLGKMGYGNGKCRKPFKQLNDEEKKTLDVLYEYIKEVNNTL